METIVVSSARATRTAQRRLDSGRSNEARQAEGSFMAPASSIGRFILAIGLIGAQAIVLKPPVGAFSRARPAGQRHALSGVSATCERQPS